MLGIFGCREDRHRAYRKLPRRILVLCDDVRYFPTVASEIDYSPRDTVYDLVVCVGKRFRMEIEHPFSIADAELWFERGSFVDRGVFERALEHYSECEIRNGV